MKEEKICFFFEKCIDSPKITWYNKEKKESEEMKWQLVEK